MTRLELDYRTSRRPRYAAYALVVAAVAFTTDAAQRYRTARDDVQAKLLQLAKAASRPAHATQPMPLTVGADEKAFARQTARRLAMPWGELFRALEATSNERVALLALEPDAESRTVNLSGEAKDYLSTLTYVANLADRTGLQKVHLVRHELRQDAPGRPIVFVISASWAKANEATTPVH